ncbi:hypothetical protein RFI_13197 [Reticulomyxa filosa]|uniref:Uncharacterized protein n=1 Tax=Reticulomyxa filosa TaxID=46433 RepID=X6NF50_RETFI|nr:hypothetical protein RFI_13197 [Reticulomyxa filosa]|eukprot:ETO23962.1 hypothetical protein RFI_13197 [Reticulomyxa filosa]
MTGFEGKRLSKKKSSKQKSFLGGKMSEHDSYQALAIITFLFGLGSVFGAAWIMYSACKMRQLATAGIRMENSPIFLTNHVLWMSFCDIVQQSWASFFERSGKKNSIILFFFVKVAYTWLAPATNSSFASGWSKASCGTLGVFSQFFLVGSASWNFLIALCLMRIIMRLWIDNLKEEIPFHHLFCWGTAFICTLPPLIKGHYGYTLNIELKYIKKKTYTTIAKNNCKGFTPFECWINEPHYQLCLYAPVMAFVKKKCTYSLKYGKKKIRYFLRFYYYYLHSLELIKEDFELLQWLVFFLFSGTFFITTLRHHNKTFASYFFTGTKIDVIYSGICCNLALSSYFAFTCLASIGMGNAIIWGTSEAIREQQQKSSTIRSLDGSKPSKQSKGSKEKGLEPSAGTGHTSIVPSYTIDTDGKTSTSGVEMQEKNLSMSDLNGRWQHLESQNSAHTEDVGTVPNLKIVLTSPSGTDFAYEDENENSGQQPVPNKLGD